MNRDDVAKIFPEPMAVLETWIDQAQLLLDLNARGINPAMSVPKRFGEDTVGVFVIPVMGVLSKRDSLTNLVFGGTALDDVSRQLKDGMESPRVGSIVFDVDSPGGSVAGVQELADQIYQASRVKKDRWSSQRTSSKRRLLVTFTM